MFKEEQFENSFKGAHDEILQKWDTVFQEIDLECTMV